MKALGQGSIAAHIKTLLGVLWVLFWIAATGIAIAAIVYVVLIVLTATGLLPSGLLNGGTFDWKSGGASVNISGDFNELAPQVAVPALLAAGVAVGGGLIILQRLRNLFTSFTIAEPFRRENGEHLRVIWITLLAMEVSRYAIAALAAGLVAWLGKPEGADMSVNLRVDLATWAAILVLIVLSQVFREGARLREEQDLTI
jgi:hypothetical protein